MLKNIAIQAILFVGIFLFFSWFKAIGMLETDEEMTLSNPVVATLTDETVTLKAEGKVKVLYFFAPWCQVCNFSISNLQSLYEKNERIDVVAIALDYTNKNEVEAFSINNQLTLPIAMGTNNLKKQFKIAAYPSYYVIDEDNTVVARSVGYSSELGLYLRTL